VARGAAPLTSSSTFWESRSSLRRASHAVGLGGRVVLLTTFRDCQIEIYSRDPVTREATTEV